jgi:hypothetical protein
MRIALTLLATAALVAGCKPGPTVHEQEAKRATELQKVTGWNRAFTPDVAIGAANQFGFKAAPYAAAEGGFASKGGPVAIANSFADKPNAVAFAATGKAADAIDSIRFDLALTDPSGEKKALQRTADLVRDYLFQSRIDAKPVHEAIAKGEAAKGQLSGTPYTIEKAADRLTVTFTRIGANAPANS